MNALSDRDVVQLPVSKAHPPVNHPLGPAVTVPPEISISGFEQREKTCKNCGAVRVTILDFARGNFWRAWRRTTDGPQITTDIPPPCNKDAGWPR